MKGDGHVSYSVRSALLVSTGRQCEGLRIVERASIDGVRDLLHDINNPTEATSVISLLMKRKDLYQFHLHTMLLQNKSDDNARGHLGTELANKAETVMCVEKDKEDGSVSVVRPVYTRSNEFPPFAFRIGGGELALPEIVGDYSFTEPTSLKPGKGKIFSIRSGRGESSADAVKNFSGSERDLHLI